MKSETKSLAASKEQQIGSIELMPPKSALIQFTGHRQTCGFPKSDFRQSDFILTEIRRQQPNRPPQELCLSGPGFTVTLIGWRLDLLPELLANGKINRIHAADNVLAKLIIEEPLVCSIHIYWPGLDKTIALLPPRTHQ